MDLKASLLQDSNLSECSSIFSNCLNARGLYHPMQFVLSLRYDLHMALEKVSSSTENVDDFDSETIQAMSTFFHETIHWWQHIGSVSGMILSMCYPAQIHLNSSYLKDLLIKKGPIKPIKNLLSNEDVSSEDMNLVNIIMNNFYDIEYFKGRVIKPKIFSTMINEPMFESVGHSFNITYAYFINLLSTCVDPNFEFLPNAKEWVSSFDELDKKKIRGYYYKSPVDIPCIGLLEIYEGQARFLQMLYLYFASKKALSWDDFDNQGMLNGEYYSAFSHFLQLTKSERPQSIDSPLVSLFLLVLDISMNPGAGFPFDIVDFPAFIESTDPGIRFMKLCDVIAKKHPEVKVLIKENNCSEYFYVSDLLCKEIKTPTPLEIAIAISKWPEKYVQVEKVMNESVTFSYSEENLPVRLLLSRFIQYQIDKANHPSFFCWPSMYMFGEKMNSKIYDMYIEHQAIFKDSSDGDIYPSILPGRDKKNIQDTFGAFYQWISVYELCRQWMIEDDDFNYDFFWLTLKYSRSELKEWAKVNFVKIFGVEPEHFTNI
ncbi:hypothetical protein [Pectobacterium versatile]|uniref:hypothetical protein n=1 Tax=Pectobacterium versatile TaxID=2488639 RepID=UPI001F251481|nr:hypothetical protein [Pectobacterium versatile]